MNELCSANTWMKLLAWSARTSTCSSTMEKYLKMNHVQINMLKVTFHCDEARKAVWWCWKQHLQGENKSISEHFPPRWNAFHENCWQQRAWNPFYKQLLWSVHLDLTARKRSKSFCSYKLCQECTRNKLILFRTVIFCKLEVFVYSTVECKYWPSFHICKKKKNHPIKRRRCVT